MDKQGESGDTGESVCFLKLLKLFIYVSAMRIFFQSLLKFPVLIDFKNESSVSFIQYKNLYSVALRYLRRSFRPGLAEKDSLDIAIKHIRKTLGNKHKARGSPFQTEGSATENA